MTERSDGQKMAAGLKALARLEARRAASERAEADKAAARPAPPEITGRPGRPVRSLAQTVRCPFPSCHAAVGEPCRTVTGRALAAGPHPSRLDAASASSNLSAAVPIIETNQTASEGSS